MIELGIVSRSLQFLAVRFVISAVVEFLIDVALLLNSSIHSVFLVETFSLFECIENLVMLIHMTQI